MIALVVVEVPVVAVEEDKVVVPGELAGSIVEIGGEWRPLISVNFLRDLRQEMSTIAYLSRNECRGIHASSGSVGSVGKFRNESATAALPNISRGSVCGD